MVATDSFLEKINDIMGDKDSMRMAMRGTRFIDELLNHLLAKILRGEHTIELQRLSIPFKLDLCRGLNCIPTLGIDPIKKLNKIRNGLAHSSNPKITEKEIKELVLLFPKPL